MSEKLPPLFSNDRRWLAATVVALALGLAATMGVAAIATRHIFAAMHGGQVSMPIWALAGLLAAGAGAAALRSSGAVVAERLGQSYAIDFRRNFYMQLTRLPANDIAERRNGALAIRFIGDLAAMRDWVSLGMPRIISGAVIMPAAILALYLLDPILALAILVPFAAVIIGLVIAGTLLPPAHCQLRSERANLSIDMMERVSHAPQIRLIGRARSDFKLLRRRGTDLMSAASRRAFLKSALRAIAEFGSAAAGCAILIASFVSGLTPATAAAGLAIVAIVSLPLRELADVWDIHAAWLVAREKSEKIFSKVVLDRSREGIRLSNAPITIALENVSMGPIDRLSLTIEAGSKTAIIDRCGARRDWLFNLCAGLTDVCKGTIKYNGTDLNEIRMADFAKRVHILTLNDPILQGSLRRNLTLGIRKRPRDAAIAKICREFGFSATWEKLGGLDGRVYEDGRNLSVSEKFRLLVIRAALKNSNLLVVNDPGDVLGEPNRATLLRLVKLSTRTVVVFTQDSTLVEKMGAAFDMVNFEDNKAYSMTL